MGLTCRIHELGKDQLPLHFPYPFGFSPEAAWVTFLSQIPGAQAALGWQDTQPCPSGKENLPPFFCKAGWAP